MYRIQVGGGLHIKPLTLLLTGISIQALGQVDAGKDGRRIETLRELLGQLGQVLLHVEGLQGGEGALVLIAKKLQVQVSGWCWRHRVAMFIELTPRAAAGAICNSDITTPSRSKKHSLIRSVLFAVWGSACVGMRRELELSSDELC